MRTDRTGGIRRKGGVKPPVAHFSSDFSPLSEPPVPFDMSELRMHASARGFVDGDTPQADYMLNRISYQHASSYFGMLEDADGNLPDRAAMSKVHRIIIFDRKLQAHLMEYIGLFELQFRAQYSYRLSMEKGAFAHRSPRNFKDARHYESFLKRYEEEFNRQLRSGNADLAAAYERYGDAPIWMAVEIMSFGTLSMLYGNTKSKAVRRGVAASFGVDAETLASWSRAVASVRNQCAHFGRVLGRNLVSRPKTIPGIACDNGNPFYILLVLAKLLGDDGFFTNDMSLSYGLMMLGSVASLLCEFNDVCDVCGIPGNWLHLLFAEEVMGQKVEKIPDESTIKTKGVLSIVIDTKGGTKHILEFG